jgi:hypothetical protein
MKLTRLGCQGQHRSFHTFILFGRPMTIRSRVHTNQPALVAACVFISCVVVGVLWWTAQREVVRTSGTLFWGGGGRLLQVDTFTAERYSPQSHAFTKTGLRLRCILAGTCPPAEASLHPGCALKQHMRWPGLVFDRGQGLGVRVEDLPPPPD